MLHFIRYPSKKLLKLVEHIFKNRNDSSNAIDNPGPERLDIWINI